MTWRRLRFDTLGMVSNYAECYSQNDGGWVFDFGFDYVGGWAELEECGQCRILKRNDHRDVRFGHGR